MVKVGSLRVPDCHVFYVFGYSTTACDPWLLPSLLLLLPLFPLPHALWFAMEPPTCLSCMTWFFAMVTPQLVFFFLIGKDRHVYNNKKKYTRCIRRVPKRSPQKWGHKKPRIKISKISKISIVDFLKIWGNIGGNLDKNMMRRKLMKIHKNIDF